MSDTMLILRTLLQDRNERETNPFISINQANATLLNQVDALQQKCEIADRELVALRTQLSTNPSKAGKMAAAAALRNETRLHEKLEKLQEECNATLKIEAQEKALALETAHLLAQQKDLVAAQEIQLQQQQAELEQTQRAVIHLQDQVKEAQRATLLAVKQYDGLKVTIRQLQKENDSLQKENYTLEFRLVDDKRLLGDELNTLTETIESLKREVDMLRSLKAQEEQRSRGSFGGTNPAQAESKTAQDDGRQIGDFGVIVPNEIKLNIFAHAMEGTCLRYDTSGIGLLATSSSDATVKVFDANLGHVLATLRGSPGSSIISCDLSNNLVVGAGSDKTCRVWNLRTQRMIHHLVGHAQKVTCVRLFNGDKSVLTASSDRSLKVWDISLKTYKQTVTLRHSSTSNCVDVASDSMSAVSGHLDGGLRIWNLHSGERTADMPGVHEAAVTSVRFHPLGNGHILTNAADSCLKVVDVRTGMAIQTFRHLGFQTVHNWSSSAFSPDGRYVIAGSNSTGNIYVWDTTDGSLKKTLEGHTVGVCAIDWGRGSQQQVASVDRMGMLILWA
ncbi:hypothetical protein MPSEU_000716200 [Mayamaea pseudoterrestris]|nr:hypothetical protein MPSEU_000716200 [Mayamaea pseudoterrestris]